MSKQLNVRTLFMWEKKLRKQRHLERKKRVVKKRKIPLKELNAFIEAHPNPFLSEIQNIFECLECLFKTIVE